VSRENSAGTLISVDGSLYRPQQLRSPLNFVIDLVVTAGYALWWDTRLGPRHARIASRADRLWSWSMLLPMCDLVQLAKRRFCHPLVIWANADNGQFVRAGMSILIEQYR
jgi:hypothetical protein